jgi:hypothetical protein
LCTTTDLWNKDFVYITSQCTEPQLHQQVVQLLVTESNPFFIVSMWQAFKYASKFLFAMFSLFMVFLLSKSCLFCAYSSSEIIFTLRLFDVILNKWPRKKVVSFWSYGRSCIPLERTKIRDLLILFHPIKFVYHGEVIDKYLCTAIVAKLQLICLRN